MEFKEKEKKDSVIKVEDEQKKLQEENVQKNKEQADRKKKADAAKQINEQQDEEIVVRRKKITDEDQIDDEFNKFILDQKDASRKLKAEKKGDWERVKNYMTREFGEENYMNASWALTELDLRRVEEKRERCFFWADSRAEKLKADLCKHRNFKNAAGIFAQRRALLHEAQSELKEGSKYEKYGMRSSKEIYAESAKLLKCKYITGTGWERIKSFFHVDVDRNVDVAAMVKHAVNRSVYCETKLREFADKEMVLDHKIDEQSKKRILALCKVGYRDNTLISNCMDMHGDHIDDKLQKAAQRRASQFEMMQYFMENIGTDALFSAGISTWGALFKAAGEAADAASAGNMGKQEKQEYYTTVMNGLITNKIREARLGLAGIYDLKKRTAELAAIEANKEDKKEDKKAENKDAKAKDKKGDKKDDAKAKDKKETKKKEKKKEDPYGRSKAEIKEDDTLDQVAKKVMQEYDEKNKTAKDHKAQETAVWKAVWGACNTFNSTNQEVKLQDERWIRGVHTNDISLMKERLEDINNTVSKFVFTQEMTENPEEYVNGHLNEYLKLRGYFMAYEKLTDLSWIGGEQSKYSAIENFFKEKRGSYLLFFGDQVARQIDQKRVGSWKAFQKVVDRILILKGYNPDMTGDVTGFVSHKQWKDAKFRNEQEKKTIIEDAVKVIENNNAELLRDEFELNYARFYGYKEYGTKTEHAGFQEKLVAVLDNQTITDKASVIKAFDSLKPDLMGAVESMKGMVAYFERYPVSKYPKMYEKLEAFNGKKEDPKFLAEKLERWSGVYRGYLAFINQYADRDTKAVAVVNEAIKEKVDFRELLARGNETVIANHYVKGGNYKTFRTVLAMDNYKDKYTRDGYKDDYKAALEYVENFKFSNQWFKADYVMNNLEQYLRFTFSIETIRDNAKKILDDTTPAYQNKINALLTMSKSFMRIVNNEMADKLKVNCDKGGYATDEMVEAAKAYHSEENKK